MSARLKHVIVIASGETERRSLPHLLSLVASENIVLDEVRRPDRNKHLSVEMAEKLVKAAWYARPTNPPDKFIILLDTDGKDPEEVYGPFRRNLPGRLGPNISAALQVAYAQWHLEAWYFADSNGLRDYLGRNLGSIDSSDPDGILNPKLHLTNLLGDRAYTAVVSEEIAINLNPAIIADRSPSFRQFLVAVRNGDSSSVT